MTDSKATLVDECFNSSGEAWNQKQTADYLGYLHLHESNQRADELVKRDRQSLFVRSEPASGIAYQVIKQKTKDLVTKHHLTYWGGGIKEQK